VPFTHCVGPGGVARCMAASGIAMRIASCFMFEGSTFESFLTHGI
jgi:hypothetical protein